MPKNRKDEIYIHRAMRLAGRGRGRTSPNPMVGAVIVKGGRVGGEGYHRRSGGPHAEIEAISAAGSQAVGATLYVNLEPCCHRDKRTPPCTHAIIQSGIRNVVLAMRDPNPQVKGRGIAILRQRGIQIIEGILEGESRNLNEIYNKYISENVPFVISKTGMTLDGKIYLGPAYSHWITGERARLMIHRLRDQVDAILVGIRTIIVDDPRLTTRLPSGQGKDPHRIILDSALRIPLTAKVLTQSSPATTWIATTKRATPSKIDALESKGASVLVLPEQDGQVSLKGLLRELGRREVSSLLVEGGAEVTASALRAGIVDKLIWFVAPRLLGGKQSLSVIGGSSPLRSQGTLRLKRLRWRRIGEDLMVEGYL